MATLEDKHFSSAFSGLATQAYVALGIAGIGIITFESLRRLKRPTIRVRRGTPDGNLTSEDYAMNGYLYQARAFVPFRPVNMHGPWPLTWVWPILRTKTSDIALRSGVDSAAYVCVLNGIWLYAVSQLLTTFPVLLAIHLHFSPNTYASTDINRASLSALVSDKNNVHLLFVHVILLWWMTLAFYFTIFRVGRQILNHRKLVLRDDSHTPAQHVTQDPEHRGWRHRTLLVTNVPTEMRTEERLASYFDHLLKTPALRAVSHEKGQNKAFTKDEAPEECAPMPVYPPVPVGRPLCGPSDQNNPISRIVLVRRTGELHATHKKRMDALHQLERVHVQLASNVLRAIQRHLARKPEKSPTKPGHKSTEEVELDYMTEKLKPYLDPLSEKPKSFWEVLGELPKEMLDPYQPTKALKVFRNKRVPELDYWVARFNLYHLLLEDLRASPRDNFKPTPTAFVTFKSAALARSLAQHVPHHPERVWACILERAPDTRDLVWDKLAASSFRGDVLRAFVVRTLVWVFIVVWVIPVGLLLSLVSLNNLASIIPALDRYLSSHASQKALLSSLLPTILLSVLLFLVPTMLIQLSNRAQHFITISKLHHTVLCRYHAFLLVDVVIIFCAGRTALESLFKEPGKILAASSLLNRIASAFPAAAPFFIGWSIIVTGVHPFFELMLLGFPLINQIGVSTAGSLRKRLELALPRSINIYSVLPTHLLVLTILNVFALLNPLVICFGVVYWTVSLTVFKRSFVMYYWRRNYDLNGNLIFIRFMRYSLDGLMLSQVVLIALLWVSRFVSGGAACIPPLILTFFFKLAATRIYSAYVAILDVEEADAMGDDPHDEQQLIETINVPLAPSFLKKTWPFNRFHVRLRVNRSQKQRKRREAILKAQEKEQDLSHRPPASRSRSSPNTTDPEAKPILGRPSSEFESSDDTHVEGSPIKTTISGGAPKETPSLVVPHTGQLVRDDRTDFSAQYDNPYLVASVTKHLWLPRDPLLPLDLNDSVDYYGPALVSSKGGSGKLGVWDEVEDSPDSAESPAREELPDLSEVSEDADAEGLVPPPISPVQSGRPRRSTVASTLSSRAGRYRSNSLAASLRVSGHSAPASPQLNQEGRQLGANKDDSTSRPTPHIALDPKSNSLSRTSPSRKNSVVPPTSGPSLQEQSLCPTSPDSLGISQPSARGSAASIVSRQPSIRSHGPTSPPTQEDMVKEAVLEEWIAEESRHKKKRKNSIARAPVGDVEQLKDQEELDERLHERAADRSWFRARVQPTANVVEDTDASAGVAASEIENQ